MASILVIDDDPTALSVTGALLSALGHKPRPVESVRAALEAMAGMSFDLVMTDIVMPDQDGLDAIRVIRAAAPGTPVLAISGGGRWMDMDHCLRMARRFGADGVLPKPFGKKELQAAIAQTTGIQLRSRE